MDDKINIKDILSYIVSTIVFIALFFALPADRLSYTFGISDFAALIAKFAISLILTIAIHIGLQYILYPKSKTEIEKDLASLSYTQSLEEILKISTLAMNTIPWVRKKASVKLLTDQAGMLTSLHLRFKKNHKPVELNRFLLLMQEYVTGLTNFGIVMNKSNFFTDDERDQEVKDTEDGLLPKAQLVLFNIGRDFDKSVLLNKNVADGTFNSLAKSFAYLQELDEES